MVELSDSGTGGRCLDLPYVTAQVADYVPLYFVALHKLFGYVSMRRSVFMKIVVVKPSKFWSRILKTIFKI